MSRANSRTLPFLLAVALTLPLADAAQAQEPPAAGAQATPPAEPAPATPPADDLAARIHAIEQQAQAAVDAGRAAEAVSLGGQAVGLVRAAPSPDPRLLALALEIEGVALWQAGDYAGGHQRFGEVLALLEPIEPANSKILGTALFNRGISSSSQKSHAEADTLLTRADANYVARGETVSRERAFMLCEHAIALSWLNRFEEAARRAEQAAAVLAQAVPDDKAERFQYEKLTVRLALPALPQTGIESYRRALALATALGEPSLAVLHTEIDRAALRKAAEQAGAFDVIAALDLASARGLGTPKPDTPAGQAALWLFVARAAAAAGDEALVTTALGELKALYEAHKGFGPLLGEDDLRPLAIAWLTTQDDAATRLAKRLTDEVLVPYAEARWMTGAGPISADLPLAEAIRLNDPEVWRKEDARDIRRLTGQAEREARARIRDVRGNGPAILARLVDAEPVTPTELPRTQSRDDIETLWKAAYLTVAAEALVRAKGVDDATRLKVALEALSYANLARAHAFYARLAEPLMRRALAASPSERAQIVEEVNFFAAQDSFKAAGPKANRRLSALGAELFGKVMADKVVADAAAGGASAREIDDHLASLALFSGAIGDRQRAYQTRLEQIRRLRAASPPDLDKIASRALLAARLTAPRNAPDAEIYKRAGAIAPEATANIGNALIGRAEDSCRSAIGNGAYVEAERTAKAGLEKLAPVLGTPPRLAALRLCHARALYWQARGREAEDEIRAIMRDFGPEGENSPSLMRDLAGALDQQGRAAEAVAIQRKVIATNASLDSALHSIANSFNTLRDYENARAAAVWAIALRIGTFGGIGLNMAKAATIQADALYGLGRFADSERWHRRAFGMADGDIPLSHPAYGIGTTSLARSIEAQRRPADAERLYRRALEVREQALPPSSPEIAESLIDVSRFAVLREPAEALRLSRQATGIIAAARARGDTLREGGVYRTDLSEAFALQARAAWELSGGKTGEQATRDKVKP